MADNIAKKFANEMGYYLPSVKNLIDDYKQFKSVAQLKLSTIDAGQVDGAMDKNDQANLKFMINNVKSEVNFMKNMWNAKKLKQIDFMENKMKQAMSELEVIKIEMECKASQATMDKI